jgi:hypothetical protein
MSVKKRSLLLGCLLLAVLLGGCGKAKGAGGLVSQAQKEHGPCTVVSETQGSDGGWEVVLYDELQGFEYEVSSYMDDFSLDGSSFGSFPGQHDSFKQRLIEHVCTQHRQEMDDISAAYGVSYDPEMYPDIVINASSLADGRLAAAELARTLQTDNLYNRMDGVMIRLYVGQNSEWVMNDYAGSVTLPDTTMKTADEEELEYFIERAHMETDRGAVYLRTEYGSFKDTGADITRVNSVMGTAYPETDMAPVRFFYFRASNGKEYYLCDFTYYDESFSDYSWYTNYDSIK